MVQEQIPQKDQPSFGETLAPRVYAWSTTELDYRPRGSDLEVGARSRAHGHSPESDPDYNEFTPQALVRYRLDGKAFTLNSWKGNDRD